ncbi:hypothetical protein [Porphyrobacter sp. GA68]|uniref:hypothetical protein n=1 Tax=Porphyrobacter sp. GA68 TaxID=2883480 RepID=UPI001D193886|nr:hypothetical protein [Porphyrobacter sp. GA68]
MTGHTAAGKFGRSLLLATCVGVGLCAPAGAQTRSEVRVSTGIGVENNPFLLEDGTTSGASVAGEVDVSPNISIIDGRTTFNIYGNARLRHFFNGSETTGDVLLGAQGTTRVDERTQLGAGATFQTSRSAAQDAFIFGRPDLTGLEPGASPIIPIIDPTIAGARARFTSYGVTGSASRRLTERDSASLGVSVRQSETSGDIGFDYRVADAVLGYSRRLNERTTLSGDVALSRSDFLGQVAGDSINVTPMIGIQQQVSPRLNWSARVGASFSEVDDGLGGKISDTSLAFSVNGCRRDPRGTLCLTAERQARPTTFSGLSNSTAVVIGYDMTLGPRDTLRLDATYRRSDRIITPLLVPGALSNQDEFYGVSAAYRRVLTNRLSAFATASYAQIQSDLFSDRDANWRGYVGISYTFGRQI